MRHAYVSPREAVPLEPRDDGDPLAAHALSPADLVRLRDVELTGRPFLALRDQQGQLLIVAAPRPDETITIGRRDGTDLWIPWDPEVSAVHALLQNVAGDPAVVDDGLSTNGTFVNGQRVIGRQRLRDGDRIQVGRTILVFQGQANEITSPTVSTGTNSDALRLTDTQRRILIALCAPLRDGAAFAAPASNQAIAGQLYLSVDAVKAHLRVLFGRFELGDLPQNQKRARLAQSALQFGIVSMRDLEE